MLHLCANMYVFCVQANSSVLSWWFRDKGPYLVTDDSLTVWLELSLDGRIWEIHIEGIQENSTPLLAFAWIISRYKIEL